MFSPLIPQPSDKHRSGSGVRRMQGGKPQQSTVPKIKEALNFMKKHSFEVPFIANYRREYVEPELEAHDLWKILRLDEKVCSRERGEAFVFTLTVFVCLFVLFLLSFSLAVDSASGPQKEHEDSFREHEGLPV